MNSTALLSLYRADVRDQATPYLWSDDEIYSYIDDAQKMFCRLMGGIADATSSVTQVNVTSGDIFVAISPLILKLREARRTSDGRELEILNFEDLQTHRVTSDYGFGAGVPFDMTPGEVRALIVGMEANKVRLVRIPDADLTLSLVVYRLPLITITNAGNQNLEIDEQHHRHLMLWMKHLAHMKQDAETYDRGRSDKFEAQFRDYCDQAKAEREKREHKYRAVAYGGY